MAKNTPVTLAAVTGAHGVAGDVRLKLFGEGWETLKSYESFNEGTLTLKKVRSDNKRGAIARFAEANNRSEAEKLRGTVISVARDDLPELDEGEFYYSDLIDLAVVTDSGDVVGRVLDVANYGASEVVEIEKPDGKRFMVPFTEDAVPEWDDERLVVNADFVDG